MAGSRRSPTGRDQWRAAGDMGDPQERPRQRGPDRDRGRRRGNWGERPYRPKGPPPQFDRPPRLPAPRPSRFDDREPPPRKHLTASSDAIPPLRGPSGSRGTRPSSNYRDSERYRSFDESAGRGSDYLSAQQPPFKRKRTRSPSPGPHSSRSYPRSRPSGRRATWDRSSPPYKSRGSFPNRGGFGRKSPPRGPQQANNFDRFGSSSRRRFSRSPVGRRRGNHRSRRRSKSPPYEDYSDRDSFYRSPSQNSARSRGSRLSRSSRSSIRREFDSSLSLSRSPRHQSPKFDADDTSLTINEEVEAREQYSTMRGSQRSRPTRPHSLGSRDRSPHPDSPYHR